MSSIEPDEGREREEGAAKYPVPSRDQGGGGEGDRPEGAAEYPATDER